jgi:hypothetical protein
MNITRALATYSLVVVEVFVLCFLSGEVELPAVNRLV